MTKLFSKSIVAGLTAVGSSLIPLGGAITASPPELKAAPAGAPSESRKAPTQPLTRTGAEVEALRADVESLDAQIQEGLTQMGSYLKEFEEERRTWVSLDMTIEAARKVNLSLLARNRTVLSLYDERLSEPISRFKERLKEAPAAYRRLAEERRSFAKEADLDFEREGYEQMATLCEAAARLCELRYRDVFDGGSEQKNALMLAETIANMRKYEVVHARWEDTFARYPSSLDDRRMAALFAHLSVYAEDLHSFTQGVEALTEAMRRRADGQGSPKSDGSADPKQTPPASNTPVASIGRPVPAQVIIPPRPSPPRTNPEPVTPPARKGQAVTVVGDFLQPGAVLEGSFVQGALYMPARLVIEQRSGGSFSGKIYTRLPDGRGESRFSGRIVGSLISMESARIRGNISPRSTYEVRIDGFTISGVCNPGTRVVSTFSFTLVAGGGRSSEAQAPA